MAVVGDHTRLKAVDSFKTPFLMNELETNLKIFFDWGFLGLGGWVDVNIPTSGAFGGNQHQLQPVFDPSYNDGQVWQTFRKDIVWETGVSFDDYNTNPDPIRITGFRVNSVSVASGDSSTGWHINYPLGRVIFDTAISPTNDTVELDYSYRFIQIYRADDAPWWQELHYQSFRADDSQFSQFGTGDWSIGAQHRIQMPAIVIECVPRGSSRGFELGNGALVLEQDVLFYVLAENRFDRNNLLDTIRLQHDKTIWLFNSDSVAASTGFPLDFRGMKTGDNMYPDLVNVAQSGGFRWRQCRFADSVISEVESPNPNLFQGVCRVTTEVIFGNI